MKKLLALLLTMALTMGLLSACGDQQNENSDADNDGDAAVTYREEVVIGTNSKTTTINPTAASSVAHNIFFQLTHNGLTGYDETTGEILPELATEWVMSEDGLTWSFTLRDDAYFHNGEKFTAEDVAFTFEYGKTAENGTVKSFYTKIAAVNVIDETHVDIVLNTANMDLLYTLASPSFGILNEKAVAEDAMEGPAVGTGAYKNVEFSPGDYTLLERFDEYWGELPDTKTLRFRYIPEASARLIALENGEIDVCQSPNNTELELIRSNDDLVLDTYQSSALTYLAFNMNHEIGTDENLRLAIAYALNVQDIIDGAASGFASAANGMWGFFQFGYFDDWASVGQEAYSYNMEKAQEYMEKSNHPDGIELTFMTSTTWRVNALQIMQQQLAPLNITVKIDEVDAAGLSSKAADGNFDALMYSISYTSAADDVRRTYYPGNGANHAFYNNAEVTALLDQAVAEADEEVRKELYKEIQTIVHAECPYIPLYYANSGVAYNKNVSGAKFVTSGAHDYTYIRVPA